MSNRLQYEKSPYLLQHKDNPVNWYPWGEEAFECAKRDDKPIFLSIGYSSCHWCHVIAHESFENDEIANLLNQYFVSIKVDKEERPDIDSVYMTVCQAFTGSGGWPTSIFMTPDKKPFFAGTYFPRESRGGVIGLKELLITIHEKWNADRKSLLSLSNELLSKLRQDRFSSFEASEDMLHSALELYARQYDRKNGGFGRAPKFPTPHNILFLLSYYQRYKSNDALNMAENTLLQMYKGGIFDHIGFGFCRYSVDKSFLAPHFEKMLYDNALLILAYSKAYQVTKKELYLEIAEKTASYILKEMTSEEGGFYSAQDADSDGEEGKYYLFTPNEIVDILKDDARSFNIHFDITEEGNFEGKSIPNLLKSDATTKSFERFLPNIYEYRKKRYTLKKDDKILTSWNSFMISAMCELYITSGKKIYLEKAMLADEFIKNNLSKNDTLYVSFRDGKRGVNGFLDDYASYIFAQLSLYKATLDKKHLDTAIIFTNKVISFFGDSHGGYYLYSRESEELILRPKETYDGAIPSGNSLMAYNLVKISLLTGQEKYETEAKSQLDFIASEAKEYPVGYAMFLNALLEYIEPQARVVVVSNDIDSDRENNKLPCDYPDTMFILEAPTKDKPLKNEKTTYYVCKKHACLPPTNDLNKII